MRTVIVCAVIAAALICVCSPTASAAPDVEVYAQTLCTASEIRVHVYADMKEGVRVTSGAVRLLYDPRQLAVKSAKKNEESWYFTDGVRTFPYADPDYKSRRGEVIIIFGIMDPRLAQPGVGGTNVLLGTVLLRPAAGSALPPNPARALKGLAFGKGDPTGTFDNFVTADGIVLSAQNGVVFKPIRLPRRVEKK